MKLCIATVDEHSPSSWEFNNDNADDEEMDVDNEEVVSEQKLDDASVRESGCSITSLNGLR